MRILLDTHALLWWLADDRRIGVRARDMIEDPANDILVSIVSFWELVIKVRVGKLRLNIDEIAEAIGREGFVLLAIGVDHLTALAALPAHHRDPFDHLLLAQARSENALFMSDDRRTPLYGVPFVACAT